MSDSEEEHEFDLINDKINCITMSDSEEEREFVLVDDKSNCIIMSDLEEERDFVLVDDKSNCITMFDSEEEREFDLINDRTNCIIMSDSEEERKFVLINDKELQQYLYAITSARTVGPQNTTELRLFMANHFEQPIDSAAPLTMPRSQDTLDYMSSTLEATDFFVEFCILIFVRAYGTTPTPFTSNRSIISRRPVQEQERLLSTSLPRSMWSDKRKIRRALLRFQLYCELFHQPGDASENVSDWEERLQEQEAFWLCYEWWEVEEVKCIYQVLVFCLETAFEGGLSDVGEVLKEDIQERGLTQLRRFLDDSIARPTAFGQGYLRRFLARPFHGFQHADPDDYSYFSQARPAYKGYARPGGLFCAAGVEPEGTYRTLFHYAEKFRYVITRGPGRDRRWMPSPYPGVQLEHFDRRCFHPAEFQRVGKDSKDLRRFLRLIGWVFWRSNKLYDWAALHKSFMSFRLEAGDLDED